MEINIRAKEKTAPYIESILDSDEEILYIVDSGAISFIRSLFTEEIGPWLKVLFYCIFIIPIPFILAVILGGATKARHREHVVTNKRVIIKEGKYPVNIIEIPLWQIKSVQATKTSLLYTLINDSTLPCTEVYNAPIARNHIEKIINKN